MLMQLSINCCIRYCWYCCPVPWAATESSRAAKRDVIGYNDFASWIIVDMYIIMPMTLQELCMSRRTSCYLLFYSCARVFLFHFILLQMGERLKCGN